MGQNVVSDLTMEVTVVVQGVGCHLGTHLRTDLADEDRLFTEMLENPFAELRLLVVKAVVSPESELPGETHAGRTEDGVVGGIGQHRIHFFFGPVKVGLLFRHEFLESLALFLSQLLFRMLEDGIGIQCGGRSQPVTEWQ